MEPQKQAISQRAIAGEIGCSKTDFANFLKAPEKYGTRISSGRSEKISS